MVTFDRKNFIKTITVKNSEHDIFDLWAIELSKINKATVCLSGGIDSQFTAQVVSRYCSNVEYVCFVYCWDDIIVNTDDVISCQEFAKIAKISIDYKYINLKKALDIDILKQHAINYSLNSPQLAVLAQCINQLDKSSTIFMGAERPYLMVCPDKKVSLLGFKKDALAKHRISKEDYPYIEGINIVIDQHYYPIMTFAEIENINLVRDVFFMTPEILFKATARWADVIEETKCVDQWTDEQLVNGLPPLDQADAYHTSKIAYYKSYDFNFYQSLSKKTGFENLQKYLASTTGFYDEFDIRYREPMKLAHKKSVYKHSSLWSSKLKGDTDLLFDIVQNKIDHIKPEPWPLHIKYIW